ncbi:phage gene 29 protein family protein [Rhodococcoides fascians]|uniref:phage gene 29 protein family protein n=1 Tax=Rhodococcoides fascians TaxID=1828 RepID=UPI000569B971|nr:DUF2744 domain-containing protein [Rhodococcus fascians]
MTQPALPTPENIDPDNPRQALQPVLIDLPMMGQSITPPIDGPEGGTMGNWSETLYERGVRWHPELATKKFRPPPRGPQHLMNYTSGWVDKDEPDPEPTELVDLSQFSAYENQFHAEQLYNMGISHDPGSAPKLAEPAVRNGPAFNPNEHNVNYVLGYLDNVARNGDEAEIRRVLALEMTSKKPRTSILRKYPGR